MGLDMYIYCAKKHKNLTNLSVIGLYDSLAYIEKLDDIDLVNYLEPYTYETNGEETVHKLFKMIGYFRKANSIHRFLYEKSNTSFPDYYPFEITREVIVNLLDILKKLEILRESKFDDFEKIAKIMLPTQSGFFFGTIDYGDSYFEDIKDGLKIFNKILKEVDFDNEFLFYYASY
ncbi:MAG: hypothetical protein LBV58_02105 [Acholeplasmatales bacterium]|jgi:hypothetical protein|nr:hypothetical protein [Acholeplasmatales bacterium]